MIDRRAVEAFFGDYTSSYDASDPKIKLKIDHTYRVASLCNTIASSLLPPLPKGRMLQRNRGDSNLAPKPLLAHDRAVESSQQPPESHEASLSLYADRYPGTTLNTNLPRNLQGTSHVNPALAWLSGMLHDIGRFEQVRRYNTFSDAASIDHAQLSADLLFNEGLLQLLPVTLTKQEAKILELAIRSHSAYRLDPSLSEEELTYCDILRDADKIDIFRVNCDTPKEDIYNVTTEALINSPVSDGVKKCFENKMAVLRGLRKHPADYIVGHICLYFELVYPLSKEISRQQGYLDQLLNFPSANPDTQSWFAYMREHIYT